MPTNTTLLALPKAVNADNANSYLTSDLAGALDTLDNAVTLAASQVLTNKQLTSPIIGTSILDVNSLELLLLTATASAVNEITLANAATGNAPSLVASGETNVGLDLSAKGTGSLTLWTGAKSREALILVNTASAVNEITITQAATGNAVQIASTGGDTDIGLDLSSKGTGSVTLWTGAKAREALILVNTASAVNEITVTQAATGNAVQIAASGGDTDVGLDLSSKGTGSVTLWTGAKAREALILVNTASAVNEVTITQAATGNAPAIAATGGDTNIDLTLSGKGTGMPKLDTHYGAWTDDTDAATITFNLATTNRHRVTLGGNRTLALSNGTVGQTFLIRLLQDGTGTRTVTWFSTILWAGGSAPTLTTTINKADSFLFICTSAGNYDGHVIPQNIYMA